MRNEILILLIGVSTLICHYIAASEIPNCAFEDTVNLTSSQKFSNGSYLYEGVLVPPELTGYYDSVELYNGVRQQVQRHLRGCVCHLKQCVKFCCHPRARISHKTIESDAECAEELSETINYSPYVNITLSNNSQVLMHVLDEFVVQTGIPCSDGYILTPHLYKEDEWELFQNGTLLRTSGQVYLSRRDYCLQAYDTNGGVYVLNPMNCPIPFEEPPTLMLNTYIMMISAPFLYATILIYWLIPELWNMHTKCLICYLLSLAIGTTLIVVTNILNSDYEKIICSVIGFVTYFFLLSVFYWLNVICFDLWHNFRGTKGNVQHLTQRKRFFYYSLYAWGFPAFMTVLTIVSNFSNLPYTLKSGIGETHCWLKVDDWSALLYFHGPCLLLIIFNIVIFYLTAMKIYSIRRELQKFSQGEDSRRHLRSQQNNVWLFFRMFIVMGIGWLLEIIGYLVGSTNFMFQIADGYNAAQGFIIFVLLVMKKKVFRLIKRRILNNSDNTRNTSSLNRRTATNKSSISAVELSTADTRSKLWNSGRKN